MPLDYGSRNIVAGGSSPYIPLITNNPAFQVKIVPLDGRMEQKPNQKGDADQQKAVQVGDTVRGEELSKGRIRGKNVIGRVIAIETDAGSITGYKIIDQRGHDVILDPTTTTKIDLNGEDPIPQTAPQTQLENYSPENSVMLYEEWRLSKVIQRTSKAV